MGYPEDVDEGRVDFLKAAIRLCLLSPSHLMVPKDGP